MADLNEFEMNKMEIRGLLISNKEGCSLTEFKKQYRSMLGRALPFVQLGFKNEIELLGAMPDAVRIMSGGRDLYLYGIADEKSKHIQKMVSKQKPSKKKPSGRLNPMQRFVPTSVSRRSYELPSSSTPRWSNNLASSVPWRPKEMPSSSASQRYSELPQSSASQRYSEMSQSSASQRYSEMAQSSASQRYSEMPQSSASQRSSQLPQSSAPKRSSELSQASAPKRSSELSQASAPKRSSELSQAYASRKSYEVPPRFQVKKGLPQSVINEIVDLISKYPTGLSLRDVLIGFRRFYNKELSFKDYGFFTLQDCLEEIPSLQLKPKDNDTIVHYSPDMEKSFSESSKTSSNVSRGDNSSATYKTPKISEGAAASVQSSVHSNLSNHLYPEAVSPIPSPHYSPNYKYPAYSVGENHNSSNLRSHASHMDDLSFNERESPDSSSASEKIRNNLIKVVEKCPHGIWAREFPTLYKEITGAEFDLHSLGFIDLASFIDSMPDIFTRRLLPTSKKDSLIYPAWTANEMDRNDPKSAAFAIEIIIGNVRKILQANQEGIPLKEFLYVYSLNCSEPLYYVNLGFDSIENLLLVIANRVPLKFEEKDGVKSIHLVLSREASPLPPPVDLEPLPPKVVSPFKQFTLQSLPAELDFDHFFPVYVCTVINPEHIYIQLESESGPLMETYQELEKFYTSQSQNYTMKDAHITAGSIGAALWPSDMHWYRIRIMSVISPETVQVFYVDYGTIEIIPKTLLRYLREEFFDFPTQALKASLSYMRPVSHDKTWNPRAKSRILELCADVTVMAKINEIEQDGLLSITLCDTNGEEDIFINDVLQREGFARKSPDGDGNAQHRAPHEPPPGIPPPTLPAPIPSTNASDPNQVLGMLLQACSSLAANQASPAAAANLPLDPAVISAAIAQVAQNLPQNLSASSVDYSKLFQAPSTLATSPIPSPKPPADENWQFPPSTREFPGEGASCSSYTPPSEESSEVFDDVDDAFFDEFYQKVSVVTKRYVKRIRTGDGYMFHILIYNSKPFVSCGDICSLIWSNKDSDYLLQRLQNQESELTNTLIWENQNEEMFAQMGSFHVQGFKEMNEQTCIVVYPLNSLVQILNVFGHPSAELRSRIISESSSFNPKHPMWMELSEVEIPDGDEEFAGKTDDDKLNRLCLYDLQTMRQGIRIRRENLKSKQASNPEDVSVEEEKLRLLYNKVIGRIKEIEQICSNFAES